VSFRSRRVGKGRRPARGGAQFGALCTLASPDAPRRGTYDHVQTACATAPRVGGSGYVVDCRRPAVCADICATPVARKDTAIRGWATATRHPVAPPSTPIRKEGQFVSFELCRPPCFGGERQIFHPSVFAREARVCKRHFGVISYSANITPYFAGKPLGSPRAKGKP